MMLALAALLHDEGQDIVYFWTSILIVLLPLSIFSYLTYLVLKGYRNRERGQHEPR